MSQTQMTPMQANTLARNTIWRRSKPIFQQVTTRNFATITAGTSTIMTVNPLQIGFLRQFVVVVTGTVTNNTTGITLNRTTNGADNLLTNITFNDFTGNPRHNCSGRSLSYVESMKYNRIPGAAYTSDSVEGYVSNVASNAAPATIAGSGGTGVVTRVFEIPVMQDLGQQMAGGLWLGVNNQSTLLNLTITNTPAVASTGDPLTACYMGATAGAITATFTNVTVTVYQDYWNNVPVDNKGNPMLPQQDIQTAYMITETNSGLTFAASLAASWNFPTFSKLLGTYFAYDNGLQLLAGTDISQIALVVSNYSIIKQFNPQVLDRIARNICNASLPLGQYAIPSRQHPLDVSQYPSLQLQITPTVANAGAYALITTEILRPVQYMGAASGVGGA